MVAVPPVDLGLQLKPEREAGRQRAVVFPYSVIPGGVENVAELKDELARDPTVAAHCAGFDVARVRLVRMDHERAAYVSYRLGDHIYWTSRKLTIHKGETVITDGDHTARTRCGNLVADLPLGPLSPREPTPEALDTPVPPDIPLGPGFESALPPTSEWILDPPTIPLPVFDPIGVTTISPPPFPLGGGGTKTLGTPSLPTPEPSSLVLVCAGLAILFFLRTRAKIRQAYSQFGDKLR